jgi:acetolactate synthase I/II/III large subunit
LQGSDVIVEMLVAYGVEYVFGVPGDTSVRLYDALYRRRDEITHVLARDERSASFMADAYARLTGRPGVCESPSGAGALYNVPGVAEANASSVPVIAFTSGIDLASEYKGVITELDHHMLYKTITKWSTFMKRYDKIPDTLRRAFRVATSGRPGSVHIAFPQEVLNAEIPGGEEDIYVEEECRSYPTHRVRCEKAEVERAAEYLVAAERPVIVAGGGAIIARAWDELTELAELLDAPVGTSISGKGAIAETHPLALGVVGDNGYRDYANQFVAEADLLFYVGNKTGSVTTVRWTLPDHKSPPRIVQLDIDAQLIGNNYPTQVGLVGDAKLILADLVDAVRACGPRRRPEVAARIAGMRAAWWERQTEALESEAEPIKPQRVMAAFKRVLPDDAVIIADAGTPTPYLCAYLELARPGRSLIIPRAYGGLGYAIPAVVGAALAQPGRPIVGVCGDGSFGMSAGELETLNRLGLPVVIVVFNNSTFGWIKALQAIHSDARYLGVDFSPQDHAAVARAFGLEGVRVEHAWELENALEQALLSEGPVLLDVVTESEERDLPPVKSWRTAHTAWAEAQ